MPSQCHTGYYTQGEIGESFIQYRVWGLDSTVCVPKKHTLLLSNSERDSYNLGKLNDTQNIVYVHIQNPLINKESGNLGAVTQKYAVPSS